jgi:hypothetical protein
LSAASGLFIIVPIPYREAVVSFTREPGVPPPTKTAGISAIGTMKFDLYSGISQEH